MKRVNLAFLFALFLIIIYYNCMAKLVVMCGVPGSGKSHFSRAIEAKMGCHVYVVASDKIRELILGTPQKFTEEELVWDLFYKLAKVFSADKNGIVILDATYLTVYHRTVSTQVLKDLFDYKCLVAFELDKDLVYLQNLNRKWPVPDEPFFHMVNKYEHPGEEDKKFYDDIFFVYDHNIDGLIDEIIKK